MQPCFLPFSLSLSLFSLSLSLSLSLFLSISLSLSLSLSILPLCLSLCLSLSFLFSSFFLLGFGVGPLGRGSRVAHVLGHLLSLLGLGVGGVFPRVLDTLLQRAEADVFALAFAATLQGRQQAVPGPRSANYKKARIENRPKHLPRVRDSHVTPNQRNGPCQPKVFFRPEEQLTD